MITDTVVVRSRRKVSRGAIITRSIRSSRCLSKRASSILNARRNDDTVAAGRFSPGNMTINKPNASSPISRND